MYTIILNRHGDSVSGVKVTDLMLYYEILPLLCYFAMLLSGHSILNF